MTQRNNRLIKDSGTDYKIIGKFDNTNKGENS